MSFTDRGNLVFFPAKQILKLFKLFRFVAAISKYLMLWILGTYTTYLNPKYKIKYLSQ